MTSWAKPGAKCVCIQEPVRIATYDYSATFAKIGCVYTVRRVGIFQGVVGILLEEIVNPIGDPEVGFGGETGFPASYFRPLVTRTQEQDVELFRFLLNPSPTERLDRLAELLDMR